MVSIQKILAVVYLLLFAPSITHNETVITDDFNKISQPINVTDTVIENGQIIRINVPFSSLNEISPSQLLDKLKAKISSKLEGAKEQMCDKIETKNDSSNAGISKFVRFFKNIFLSKSKPFCSKDNSTRFDSNSTSSSLKDRNRYYFCFVFYS